MKINTFANHERIYNAVKTVFNEFKKSHLNEGARMRCYFGETHDATGDEAIRECFFQYLQACTREMPIDDEIETFENVAKAIANVIEIADEHEIEIYSTPHGLVVNPAENETAELDRKRRPRLYIGNGQILADVIK